MADTTRTVLVRQLGLQDYQQTWQSMQSFTANRRPDTVDEIWLLQHPPVFTLGRAGKMQYLHTPGDIPVIHVDRGGQVTYHGPGQLVAYVLIDLQRRAIGIRHLVSALETAVIKLLATCHQQGYARQDAPGVYVDDKKIASLGLRVRRGCSYHGLSLNVAMDLEPFTRIDPCGFPGMQVTQLADLGNPIDLEAVCRQLTSHLTTALGYDIIHRAAISAELPSSTTDIQTLQSPLLATRI